MKNNTLMRRLVTFVLILSTVGPMWTGTVSARSGIGAAAASSNLPTARSNWGYYTLSESHSHTFAEPRKAHPHWQMCECGIGDTYYDSNCQICTDPDSISVVSTVICYSKIIIRSCESLFTTPVPSGDMYSWHQDMEIYSDGYVILSTGEKRYFYNGDPKYYISEYSLLDVQINHLFKEPYHGSSLVHPHYMKCECGAEKTDPDSYCYTCYPSTIHFDINIPGSSDAYHVQEINTGRYGEAKIDCPDPSRDGYTFLGWAWDKDVTESFIDNGDVFYIEPGYNECTLYAVWKENPHVHTLQYKRGIEAGCEKDGRIEYWHCPVCGKYYLDAKAESETTADKLVLPALGHSYSNGRCTRCHTADPDAVLPDLPEFAAPSAKDLARETLLAREPLFVRLLIIIRDLWARIFGLFMTHGG